MHLMLPFFTFMYHISSISFYFLIFILYSLPCLCSHYLSVPAFFFPSAMAVNIGMSLVSYDFVLQGVEDHSARDVVVLFRLSLVNYQASVLLREFNSIVTIHVLVEFFLMVL